MDRIKKYVGVTARFDPEGAILPLSIHWDDGREYAIDKVTDKIRKASDTGGAGLRYTLWVGGRTTYLYFEPDGFFGKWFVEAKRDK